MNAAEMHYGDTISTCQTATSAGHQANHFAAFVGVVMMLLRIASMMLKGCMSCYHCPV